MLDSARWLALETKTPTSVAEFYEGHFSVSIADATDREVRLDVGRGAELRLRAPDGLPRGGLHTHYAFACPADAFDAWLDRLDDEFDPQTVDFGGMRSLYLYDPAGNCVEICGAADPTGDGDPSLAGLFEVVFEVRSLPDAEEFYADLGFEVVDRGEKRRRSRLTTPTGAFDIELWEPHLGLADARGGVHVDVGIEAADPAAVADGVDDRIAERESVTDGVRIRDPDGHYLTFVG
jgi:catechol 2,3-dioxygenase-like lactoylglutathione lyase family enzyme